MVGDSELVRLAELLRLSSETARSIARTRQSNQREICAAADKAVDAAKILEGVVGTSGDVSPIAKLVVDRH